MIESCGSLRLVTFDYILNRVLLGDATEGVVGDQPRVGILNSSQVVYIKTREVPHVPPVGASTRRNATFRVLLVFAPIAHVVVNVSHSVP